MALPDNAIGLQAVFEDEDFQRGVGAYNRSVKEASDETEEGASFMSSAWEGMAAIGQIAFNAIVIAIGAMTAELFLAVDAAMDAEEVMARVAFVVSNVADRTGVTTDEVSALADSLASVIPIDDEVIAQAIAMGLTFDGVTENNIEPLISAAADLAAWTGGDLPSAMRNLSLAISDPDRAMRLFREANITLNDEQKKTLKALADTGDTAGATEFILNELSKKGIIGLAEAMGDTTKGELTIMQTAIGNLQEALGTGLLDALGSVFTRITEFANDPATIQFFTDLGTGIGNFATQVIDSIPDIMTMLETLKGWFNDNEALIIGVLAAIGVALFAFGFTVAATAISAVSAMMPIIIVMGVVGTAVALLYTAWTENWGGIQEATAEVWAVISPIFTSVMDWLSVNLPIALQFLSDLWTNTLLPAIQTVFEWLVANVIPLFIDLVTWLQTNIPVAIQTLSAYWSNTLLPAIQVVWGWISTNLIPLFQAIGALMNTVLTLAITALAGAWQNILLPALQAVGNWITQNLQPIFLGLTGMISSTLMPALKPLSDFLSNVLRAAFDGITSAIQTLTGWIKTLTDSLNNISLPPELTPGSPTPFEIGLNGINKQLQEMARMSLPAVTQEMNMLSHVRDVPGANGVSGSNSITTNQQSTRNYLFGAQFNVNNSNSLIEILNGF
jgi:hypothetical protein